MTLALASRRSALLPGRWVSNELWRRARAVPSLDLRFAETKSLVDAVTGQQLVTYSRASAGTYVGSDGLIKTATTNLLLRSEEFDNASWTKVAASITANAIAAPNGTITAYALVEDNANSGHLVLQSFTASNATTYTFSVYVQKLGRRYGAVVFSGAAVTVSTIGIDLDSGSVFNISGIGNTAGVISRVGSTNWYRVSGSITTTSAGALDCNVRPMNGTTWADRNYQGDGTSGIYLWGAQLEQSSTVGEYIPTGATINSAPRFDHNPTTGESLGLLVEEQRSNLVLNSATFQPTSLGNPASYTVDQVAPNGTTTASRQTAANPCTFLDYTGIANALYTFSVYVRVTSGTQSLSLQLKNAGSDTLIQSVSFTATTTWQRISVSGTTAGATTGARIEIVGPTVGAPAGTVFWGAQLEAGAFPTSYIPTTTAAVTRAADVASISGSAFSGWYLSLGGTVYSDVSSLSASSGQRSLTFSDGSIANQAWIRNGLPGTAALEVYTSSSFVANVATVIGAAKSAGVIGNNDFAASINGGAVVVDTSGAIAAYTQINIGSNYNGSGSHLSGTIRRLVYWGQRLPNSTLQAITQ